MELMNVFQSDCVGFIVALLSVIVLFIRFCVETYGFQEEVFLLEHLKKFVGFIVTGVTIIVVAVPEGLPLAVTVSLAYSVKVRVAINLA